MNKVALSIIVFALLAPVLGEASGLSVIADVPNSTFFRPGAKINPDEGETIADEFWSGGSAVRMKGEYERKQLIQEEQRFRGMTNNEDEKTKVDKMDDVRRALWGEFRDQQVKRRATRLKNAADNDEFLGKPVPRLLIGALYFAYSNDAFTLVDESRFHLMARSQLQDQKAQLKLESYLINGEFNYSGDQSAADANWQLYQFSLSRGLPFWSLETGVEFRGTSQMMSASLSKKITNQITAVVDTSRPVSGDEQDVKKIEERIRLLYGLSF